MDILLRKIIYPLEYMSSFSKFNETQLPPFEAIYSTLSDTHISTADFEHAQNVWNTFAMRNIGDYHDLYVLRDMLLLADEFDNFRCLCLKNYGSDSAHNFTFPGFSWQSCLKMIDQPLELFTDLDIYLYTERGIRGSVFQISKRFACANKKYFDNSDASKPSNYNMYLVANNLHGWSMSQPLPSGEFEWLSALSLSMNSILNHPDDADCGYILEIDLT